MTEPLLQLSGVQTHIGPYHILHGVDFVVPVGEHVSRRREQGRGRAMHQGHVMARCQRGLDHVPADETSAADDQESHLAIQAPWP